MPPSLTCRAGLLAALPMHGKLQEKGPCAGVMRCYRAWPTGTALPLVEKAFSKFRPFGERLFGERLFGERRFGGRSFGWRFERLLGLRALCCARRKLGCLHGAMMWHAKGNRLMRHATASDERYRTVQLSLAWPKGFAPRASSCDSVSVDAWNHVKDTMEPQRKGYSSTIPKFSIYATHFSKDASLMACSIRQASSSAVSCGIPSSFARKAVR